MKPHLVLRVRKADDGTLLYRVATGRPVMTAAGRAYADLRWCGDWWIPDVPRALFVAGLVLWQNNRGL